MPPRRVVRSSQSVPEDTPIQKKSSIFSRILCLIWYTIKVLWYWFERVFFIVFSLILTVGLAWWLSQKPSNLRDWLPAEAILPEVSYSGNTVSIKNVRNHTWLTDKKLIPGYYDETYNLDEIERVYYLITPFSDHDGPAHTMLSFSFSGGKNVVISGEVRKERGEDFDALKGIMNQFELMYVIASEEDVIKLRTHYRKNKVYMYPIKVEKEKIQELFRSMTLRAEKLRLEPEFYHTVWNNCTTSILVHANSLREQKIPWTTKTLLPAHSDEIVYSFGLIDTKLPLNEARSYYMISDIALDSSMGSTFSSLIRKPIR